MGKFKFPTAIPSRFILLPPGRGDDRLCRRKIPNGDERHVLGKRGAAGTYAPWTRIRKGLLLYLAPIDGLYNHEIPVNCRRH